MRGGSVYVCQQCSFESAKWLGKCPDCGNWGSFVETLRAVKGERAKGKSSNVTSITLSKVSSKSTKRVSTGIPELDRVFGSGLVPGQVVLLAGQPGIGKSTILLDVSEKLGKVVYIAGEESASQIKLRANRLGHKRQNTEVVEETNIDAIVGYLNGKAGKNTPDLVVIDSVQTVYTSDLSGMAGSVGQVREAARRLVNYAKASQVPVIIVGHVTKQGSVAGPAALSHIVDTVLWFEGDSDLTLRILRVYKNRFGTTDEIGVFTMTESGLISVDDLDHAFVTNDRDQDTPGSAVTVLMEGTRPILVEIQALVTSSKMAYPKRVAQGFDVKRLEMLIAILAQRAGVSVLDRDVYINVVGGITASEPAADLPVVLAIASAFRARPLPLNLVAFSEVGLLGELRHVPFEENRLRYARRHKFAKVARAGKGTRLEAFVHKYIS